MPKSNKCCCGSDLAQIVCPQKPAKTSKNIGILRFLAGGPAARRPEPHFFFFNFASGGPSGEVCQALIHKGPQFFLSNISGAAGTHFFVCVFVFVVKFHNCSSGGVCTAILTCLHTQHYINYISLFTCTLLYVN